MVGLGQVAFLDVGAGKVRPTYRNVELWMIWDYWRSEVGRYSAGHRLVEAPVGLRELGGLNSDRMDSKTVHCRMMDHRIFPYVTYKFADRNSMQVDF